MGKKHFFAWTLVATSAAFAAGCASQQTWPANQAPSWSEKLGSTLKSGTSKVTSLVTPKTVPLDPDSKPPKPPGPGVHVAAAKMHMDMGNLAEAEGQYKKALKLDSGHLDALLGYARLEDSRNNFQAAKKHYQKAIKKHPNSAIAHNDLGLCYHRNGLLKEAEESLTKAVELEPGQKLYRNNLAAVLVDQGKAQQAQSQLITAHGPGIGNYNLGYLLAQRPDKAAALPYFHQALQADPSLEPARQWIAQLSPQQAMPPMMQPPVYAQQPMVAQRQPMMPPQPPVYAQNQAMNPPAQPPFAQVQTIEPLPPTTSAPGIETPPMARTARVTSRPAPTPLMAKKPSKADGYMKAVVGNSQASSTSGPHQGEADLQFVPKN
jgi:tetratricopeptide (TPR) repeat protein